MTSGSQSDLMIFAPAGPVNDFYLKARGYGLGLTSIPGMFYAPR
jgi:hypothetical protein